MVSGIFPSVLKRLVSECCDRDPSSTVPDAVIAECVKLNFSEIASNDSEVVKKNIDLNGMLRYACFLRLHYYIYFSLTGNAMGLQWNHCTTGFAPFFHLNHPRVLVYYCLCDIFHLTDSQAPWFKLSPSQKMIKRYAEIIGNQALVADSI